MISNKMTSLADELAALGCGGSLNDSENDPNLSNLTAGHPLSPGPAVKEAVTEEVQVDLDCWSEICDSFDPDQVIRKPYSITTSVRK